MIELIQSEIAQGSSLSISKQCSILGIDRSSIYRQLPEMDSDRDQEIRDAIHNIIMDYPNYGHRRIKKSLLRDYSITVNHKKLIRIMREEGLIFKRKRKKKIVTTDSNHSFPIYPNLVPNLEVTNVNQLWVADITYIHLAREDAYLASIIDSYSRKCIGWAFETHMRQDLTIKALMMALKRRGLQPSQTEIGLVHHSDRGSQYAADGYRSILQEYGITGSMSRKGNCYDNAMAESFNKTVKYDEVYLNDYDNYFDALNHIEYFLEEVYNKKRLHSSIGYLPPDEFEINSCVALNLYVR